MNENIGIVIYENVQPLDVLGPWEVLSCWKNILKAPVNMFLISENGSYVQCANEIVLKSHLDFENAPQLDYLIVPGGQGQQAQLKNPKMISFIEKQAKNAKYILSICTGMFILHAAGVLKGKSTTTYWRALPELNSFPDVHTVEERVVKNGNLWSSGGISSGIDLALELIAEIGGKEVAGQVQLLFEYFPKHHGFATEKTIDQLPPYYMKGKSYLPKYIREYLNRKASL